LLCSEIMTYERLAGIAVILLSLYWLFRKLSHRRLVVPADQKVVLVTGCDTGFGKAAALRLEELGYVVFAGCLNAKSADINSSVSDTFHVLQMDVTKQAEVDAALTAIKTYLSEDKDSCLWAVVNNAGIGGELGPFEMTPLDNFQRVMDVNYISQVRVTQACLPVMRQSKKGGRIVFVASLASEMPMPSGSAYGSSKAAILSFASSLSFGLEQFGIAVTAICPDFFITEIVNEENMRASLKRVVSNATSEAASAYADNIKKIQKSCGLIQRIGRKDITPVIDAIIESAVGINKPKMIVRVITTFSSVLRFIILYFPLPSSVKQLLV